MTTNLRQITEDIAAALGDGWRFDPGLYEHYCHLVHADGLIFWVRIDPSKPGRLIIRCDTVSAADIYGNNVLYNTYEWHPQITVAASRTPASIAADIRTRLLPDALAWWAKAQKWQMQTNAQAAAVEGMRQRLLAFPGSHLGSDRRYVYGPGWSCETLTSTATLEFRSLTWDRSLSLLRTYIGLTEASMQKPDQPPAQDHMFPAGDDLPLFSETPVKVAVRPFAPKPAAAQPSLLDLRPAFGAEEPTYNVRTEE
jgi:hypothetical protein